MVQSLFLESPRGEAAYSRFIGQSPQLDSRRTFFSVGGNKPVEVYGSSLVPEKEEPIRQSSDPLYNFDGHEEDDDRWRVASGKKLPEPSSDETSGKDFSTVSELEGSKEPMVDVSLEEVRQESERDDGCGWTACLIGSSAVAAVFLLISIRLIATRYLMRKVAELPNQ